jgi:hypothetical protein
MWQDDVLFEEFRQITHANMDPQERAYTCALSYEIAGDTLSIAKLTTEAHEGQGHAKLVLRELRRLYPDHHVWSFSTPLTQDGREFWPYIEPWLNNELNVTINHPNGWPTP